MYESIFQSWLLVFIQGLSTLIHDQIKAAINSLIESRLALKLVVVTQ
jgi:hypothetical protein